MNSNVTSQDLMVPHDSVNRTVTSEPELGRQPLEPLLDRLNDEKAVLFLPVIVYISLLMVLGTVGNIFVIYIYNWKLKRRSANIFIGTMAIFDLLSCLISMPVEILDLRYPYTFYNAVGCKILRFAEAVTVYGSTIILVQIAFDRYYKICKPLRILPLSKIKMMCFMAGFMAVLFASPSLILFGITRTDTPVENVRGYDCSIDERYKGGIFQKVYYYTLIVVFLVTFSSMVGFYIRIWIEIKRRRDTVISDHADTPKSPTVRRKLKVRNCSSMSDDESGSSGPLAMKKHSKRLASIAENSNQIKLSRTTIIFLSVSVAFIVSFLPGVVVMVIRSVIKDFDTTVTPTVEVLMKLFARFYLISNSINPIIYSFFNTNFRSQCRKLIGKFTFCCKKSVISSHGSLRKRSKESQISDSCR